MAENKKEIETHKQNIKLDENQAPKILENGIPSKVLGDVSGCSALRKEKKEIEISYYDLISLEKLPIEIVKRRIKGRLKDTIVISMRYTDYEQALSTQKQEFEKIIKKLANKVKAVQIDIGEYDKFISVHNLCKELGIDFFLKSKSKEINNGKTLL